MRALVFLLTFLLARGLWAQNLPALKVSVGDKLSVSVRGEKDLTGIYEVASDGTISGPGIGVVIVKGKTLLEITALVTKKLKEILLDPQVYVGMDSERTKIVYIVGLPPEAPSPATATKQSLVLPSGQVPLTASTTVRSLLSGANLGDRPDRLEAVVIRDGVTLKEIDISKLLHDDTSQFDGPLEPNDILIIRPKATVKLWFLGGFKQPGDHLVPIGLTFDQAISYVGGYDTPVTTGETSDATNAYLNRAKLELRRGSEIKLLQTSAGSPDLKQLVEAGDTFTLVLPRSVNVTVAGFVQKSGEIVVDSGVGPLAAIAKAGGPDIRGGLNQVMLFRGFDMYLLDLTPTSKSTANLKMALEADDILYVAENKRYVQVVGSVVRQGSVYLPEDKREFHVSDALAGAGGITPEGSLLRAVLLHPDGSGKFGRKQFNLDKFFKDGDTSQNPAVEPGDVLYFGTPKGANFSGLLQFAQTVAVLKAYGLLNVK